MPGKKRSLAQRIGAYGEDLFRTFARRNRLSPSKLEEDLGTDFLCMVEGRPGLDGVAQVLGAVVGACVRTTETYDGRIKLDRADVEHLLSCDFPTVIVLVHVPKGAAHSIHFRFVDRKLAEKLIAFLSHRKSNGKLQEHISFTPPYFLPEAKFEEELTAAITPGFVESLRVAVAHARLNTVIPKAHLEIRTNTNGSLTLVQIEDFTAQFEIADLKVETALCEAIFGPSDKMQARLSRLPVRPELLHSLARLPSPVVIAGAIPAWDDALKAVDSNGEAACQFEKRVIQGWFAWVHPSGFSIRISDARLHEGTYVHSTLAAIDAEVVSLLEDHPDLWAFLEHCLPGGKLVEAHSDAEAVGFDTESIGGLVPFGYFAQFFRGIQPMKLPRGTFRLQDAPDLEAAMTLEVLQQLATDGHLKQGFGFLLGKDPPDAERAIRCRVPICMNSPREGIVAWMIGTGRLFYRGGSRYGLSIDAVDSVVVETREKRFSKSQWPEVPISPHDGRTVLLSDDPNNASGSSDPSTWNCGIIVEFPSDPPPSRPASSPGSLHNSGASA